ncbi:DUF4124 domain-containing protein [Undibacterium sp. Jales W-56]|uniref:DUF4124 domain-containing protein n=1 Tax=Undibacterium sp. Jales W-56 TaxID=2897325 RepID=UPI0021D3C76D|nr:DUF4124 domain-containing protein [Undibacterium sp. Jales W-56]MCU6433416.1 DUF4124 domain-containing protein [Undibacterium sp. Jales W-56]
MKAFFTAVSWAACGFVLSSAHAEIYTCKDATGRTLTSDNPIPECANRAMYVRKSVTQSARELPRPLTPEERRKADAEEEKQKKEAQLEDQRKKDELYLLSNFKNESDIEVARQRSIANLKEKIRANNEQLKDIALIQAELRSEQQHGAKKSVEENMNLQRRANQLASAILSARASNDKYEAEQVHINTQYDDILKRYREVVQKRKK